jgi:hypothetical protein
VLEYCKGEFLGISFSCKGMSPEDFKLRSRCGMMLPMSGTLMKKMQLSNLISFSTIVNIA